MAQLLRALDVLTQDAGLDLIPHIHLFPVICRHRHTRVTHPDLQEHIHMKEKAMSLVQHLLNISGVLTKQKKQNAEQIPKCLSYVLPQFNSEPHFCAISTHASLHPRSDIHSFPRVPSLSSVLETWPIPMKNPILNILILSILLTF